MSDTSRVLREIMWPALGETLYMVFWGTIFSTLLGLLLAVVLIVTSEDGLHPCPIAYKILDGIINILRSFPFVIFAIAIMPITRLVVGTIVGKEAALFPLVIVSAPFVGRIMETDLRTVDSGLIEAARSFGAYDLQIIFRVIFVEALPSLCLSITLVTVEMLAGSAVAGVLGAGGLGSVAMIYGYQSYNDFVMYGTVAILVVMVYLIQSIGYKLYKKLK